MQTTAKPGPEAKITDLLHMLGYGGADPSRNKNVFLGNIEQFRLNYLARGNTITFKSTKRSEEAVQCAMQFLQEDFRAEKLWPANINTNHPVWPTDREL